MNNKEIIEIARELCLRTTLCKDECNDYRCSYKDQAENLYKAGYRRIGKNQVVVDVKTWEDAPMLDYKQEIQKETAQDILDKIKYIMLYSEDYEEKVDALNRITKKYGVKL